MAATISKAVDQIGMVRATASGRKMSETEPLLAPNRSAERRERADAVVREEDRDLDSDGAGRDRHGAVHADR